MSTSFIDVVGHQLRISARNINAKDCVSLGMPIDDGAVWREIPVEDAPAVALAILEAAGIREDDTSRPNLSSALVNLQVHEAHRKDDAAREALDAKVAEFRELSLSAIALVFRDSNSQAKVWSALSNEGREGWRARYRAARKFFEES